jgi:ABC-type glycerol-3-phosphate transport system substrate-binding protein
MERCWLCTPVLLAACGSTTAPTSTATTSTAPGVVGTASQAARSAESTAATVTGVAAATSPATTVSAVAMTSQASAATSAAINHTAPASTETSDPKGGAEEIRMAMWPSSNAELPVDEQITANILATGGPKITLENDGYPGIGDKLKAQLAGGTAPDLTMIADWTLPLEPGVLVDLDSYAAQEHALSLSAFAPQALDYYRDNARSNFAGNLYSIPYTAFTQAMAVNLDVLQKVGIPLPRADWTWDTLLQLAKQATQRGANGVASTVGVDGVIGSSPSNWLPVTGAFGGAGGQCRTDPLPLRFGGRCRDATVYERPRQ